jgi:hypothetical protein
MDDAGVKSLLPAGQQDVYQVITDVYEGGVLIVGIKWASAEPHKQFLERRRG